MACVETLPFLSDATTQNLTGETGHLEQAVLGALALANCVAALSQFQLAGCGGNLGDHARRQIVKEAAASAAMP
jgi:hypothetical protein